MKYPVADQLEALGRDCECFLVSGDPEGHHTILGGPAPFGASITADRSGHANLVAFRDGKPVMWWSVRFVSVGDVVTIEQTS